VGLAERWNYVASMFVVADGVAASVWQDLERDLDGWTDQISSKEELLAAVSDLPVPGLVVKLLARTAPSLHGAYEQAWSLIRKGLWGSDRPDLRRY
jgi:urease accessory protein